MALLGVVYLVWGSTYLGIRVAVRGEGGFPPFVLGAVRLGSAGVILLALTAMMGRPVRAARAELASHATSGLLLWVGGNGLVVWALQRVDSGYAALLMSLTPIFVVLLEAGLARRAPGVALGRALLLGTAGIGLLSAPALAGAGGVDALGLAALVLAALSWAIGTLYQQRRHVDSDPLAAAGWQLVFAGLGFAAVALLRGEAAPSPSPQAWAALAYLVVVGSVLGFGSYVWALRLLPGPIVMTHAYVNPVIAVLLGWALIGEPLTLWTWAGTGLILLGVVETLREITSRGRGRGTRR
ncbi:MAG TPA: EamA family transporter [Kofleriaceae bacterium]|nr:EamA family transporter [Kofleriaceae bacterium]